MKYFVLGAIASGTLLYGMSIIYGLTGTLDLGVIGTKLTAPGSLGVILGVTFIVVAVAFKLGAVPFHMWLPDVYEGAPTSVTLFVGTAPKIAYFALMLRLLAHGLAGTSADWTLMLTPLAVLTLIVGNVVAIVQIEPQAHAGVLHHRHTWVSSCSASSRARRAATRPPSTTRSSMCSWRSAPSA